ncbi:high affinity immunoglobulin epsilon receptor subunit gamma [Diretmus argenteus]
MWGTSPLLLAVPLWMNFGSAAALTEPEICYVLDGILFLYGIVLTALYCRLKVRMAPPYSRLQKAEEGIYTGLKPHATDTYETIGIKK